MTICTRAQHLKDMLKNVTDHIIEDGCTECAQEYIDYLEKIHQHITKELTRIDVERSEIELRRRKETG